MSAKRTVGIVLAAAAATWLVTSLVSLFRTAQQIPAVTFPVTAATTEPVTITAPSELPEENGGPDTVEEPPVSANVSADERELWERRLDGCVRANPGAVAGCKTELEPRDPEWAPKVEQIILDFMADTNFVRVSVEPSMYCRVTFCRIALDVDRAGLTDHLRTLGQYDEAAAGPDDFAYVTLGSRWAYDRTEELRLALVSTGLLEADSEVEVRAVDPADPERASFLWIDVFRCQQSNTFCSGQ
jgi:hypothetical protein